MLSIEEQLEQAREKVAKLEHQKRVLQKKAKDAQKKKDQRRNYIIGELVSKYFPEVLNLEPGTKSENAVTFASLEAFLSTLAADQELVNWIKRNISNKELQS